MCVNAFDDPMTDEAATPMKRADDFIVTALFGNKVMGWCGGRVVVVVSSCAWSVGRDATARRWSNRRSGQRPRKKHFIQEGRGRAWRTDRRGGARDLPRAQGEDMAELMRRMMSMISSRMARSSSAEQNEPDGMLESDSE